MCHEIFLAKIGSKYRATYKNKKILMVPNNRY